MQVGGPERQRKRRILAARSAHSALPPPIMTNHRIVLNGQVSCIHKAFYIQVSLSRCVECHILCPGLRKTPCHPFPLTAARLLPVPRHLTGCQSRLPPSRTVALLSSIFIRSEDMGPMVSDSCEIRELICVTASCSQITHRPQHDRFSKHISTTLDTITVEPLTSCFFSTIARLPSPQPSSTRWRVSSAGPGGRSITRLTRTPPAAAADYRHNDVYLHAAGKRLGFG